MPTLSIILNTIGAGAAAAAIGNVTGGLNDSRRAAALAAADARSLAAGLDAAGTAAARAAANANFDRWEKLTNIGAGIAVAGAAMLSFADNMSNAFVEADRLGGKLNSLMTGKGLADGINQVKELGNEIAGLTGGDDDEIATAIAGAIASGRLQGLREYGIVIDQTGKDAIEAAGKISAQAQATETLAQVLRAGGEAAKSLRDGMDPATAALGEFNVRWGNLEEGIGQGAAEAKAAILGGILSPIMSVLENSPKLQKATGTIFEIGGAALSAGGSMLGLAGQVGMVTLAFPTLAASAAATWATITAGATAAAAATWAAVVPMLAYVAAALLAAAAIYALDKALHYKEDQELRANIAAGDATDNERLEMVNKERAKKHKSAITLEQLRAWESDTSGQMDPGGEMVADPSSGADVDAIQKKLDALSSGTVPMPTLSMPSVASVVAPVGDSDGKASKAAKASSDKSAEKFAKEAERAKTKAEDEAIVRMRDQMETEKVRVGDKFDAQIETLQAQIDKAQEDADGTKVRSLTLELEKLKAQKDRALKKIEADAEGLEDERRAAEMDKRAAIEESGAMRRAGGIADAAVRGLDGGKNRDSRIRAALAMMRNGGQVAGGFSALNPGANSGNRFAERAAPSTLQVGEPTYSQDAQGNDVIQFPPLKVPNRGLAALEGQF